MKENSWLVGFMKSLIFLLLFIIIGCSASNLDYVKDRASETWRDQGFEIVGYQGYEWKFIVPFTSYGGAAVWYRLKNIPDNNIIYEACLQRWGDEIHIYNLKAIDAIKPTNRQYYENLY